MEVGVRRGQFSMTQRGRKMLHYLEHLYQKNKQVGTVDRPLVLWECERRRELRCPVYVTTDEEGIIVKDVTIDHVHDPPAAERAAALIVRDTILQEALRRPEAAPASLLNDFVTPTVASQLGSERTLKRAIQRKRKTMMPTDPPSASDVVITDTWKMTLENKEWYLGEATVDNDSGYIFATEENLNKLQVIY